MSSQFFKPSDLYAEDMSLEFIQQRSVELAQKIGTINTQLQELTARIVPNQVVLYHNQLPEAERICDYSIRDQRALSILHGTRQQQEALVKEVEQGYVSKAPSAPMRKELMLRKLAVKISELDKQTQDIINANNLKYANITETHDQLSLDKNAFTVLSNEKQQLEKDLQKVNNELRQINQACRLIRSIASVRHAKNDTIRPGRH